MDFNRYFRGFGYAYADSEIQVELNLRIGEHVEEFFLVLSNEFLNEWVVGNRSRYAVLSFFFENIYRNVSQCIVMRTRMRRVAIMRATDPLAHPRIIAILKRWPYYIDVGYRIVIGNPAQNIPYHNEFNPWVARNRDDQRRQRQNDHFAVDVNLPPGMSYFKF